MTNSVFLVLAKTLYYGVMPGKINSNISCLNKTAWQISNPLPPNETLSPSNSKVVFDHVPNYHKQYKHYILLDTIAKCWRLCSL